MPSVGADPKGAVVNGIFYVMKPIEYHIGQLQAFYAYEPVTDTWSTRIPMPTARNGYAIGTVNGIIYTAGGWDGGSMYNTLEAYDTATDTWITNLAPIPTARRGQAGAVVNGIFYVMGGNCAYASPYFRPEMEAYDPSTNTWATKAPMLAARDGLGAGVIDGIIYAVGGYDEYGVTGPTVEAYDPSTNTWTTKTSMPTARSYLMVEVMDGILYVIGGVNFNSGSIITLDVVEAYDPETDTWSTMAPMPTPRWASASGVINGTLYVTGGVDINVFSVATNEAFTPPVREISVTIDIKPGSFPNSINPRSRGKIPVAILTTDAFDATTVDSTTVRFGANGTETAPTHYALEDVNGDGGIDMILHFNTQETGIRCGDTSASLTGQTLSGQAIEGSDSIKTVGCK